MKTRSIFSVFAAAILAISTSSWAGGNSRSPTLPNGQPDPTRQMHTNGVPGCRGDVATIHPNLLKTMPAEACVVSRSSNTMSFECDENGNRVKPLGSKWVCVKYATHKEKFIAVFHMGANSEAKILLVAANPNEGWESRREVWATGQNQAVTWMSDRASSNYASNAGDKDHVITSGRNNGSTQPAADQQAKVDCSRLGFAQRIACEAGNNAGLGAAIGAGVRALGK